MRCVGLVVVHVNGITTEASLVKRVRSGMDQTPNGRVLAVTYPMPKGWTSSFPAESIATKTVLDPPGRRGDEDDWEFFGNVAVRVCDVKPDSRRIVKEIGLTLFRRAGEKAYVRRKSMTPGAIEDARIDALHPVFTRDIANNVWHLDSAGHMDNLVSRLGILLAWPDEEVVVIGGSGQTTGTRPDFDNDLIGVPTKVDYDWVFPTLEFGAKG